MEPGMSASELVSIEPATGAVLWRGNVSNVDEEVAIARSSWVHWASQPLTVRIETLRRFTDAVRQKGEQLADTIARETGKPMWEARNEVESVISKVDISVRSYAERTPQRRLEGSMGLKTSVRHKPHGVHGRAWPL
jgi:succinylglutamic semialdehyde dehydrogenase